ncbi:MAG: hypothetical protein ABJQ34_02550 [Paracoccaceae bacterium]
MFQGKRPPPFRIRYLRELDDNFRPRFVRLRVPVMCAAISMCILGLIMFGVFPNGGAAIALLLFVLASLMSSLKHTLIFTGYLVRNFPTLSAKHHAFMAWMEYDLDYDETRLQ